MSSVLINSQKGKTTRSISIFDINRYKGKSKEKQHVLLMLGLLLMTLLLLFQNKINIYPYSKFGEKGIRPRDSKTLGLEERLPIDTN